EPPSPEGTWSTATRACPCPTDAVVIARNRCPRQESNLVYDLRRVACGFRHTPRTLASALSIISQGGRVPCPGVEPGPTASKAAVRPAHPQGIMPSPGVEPGPRPSEGRVQNPSHPKGLFSESLRQFCLRARRDHAYPWFVSRFRALPTP